jgi:hypothetical protein
VKLALVGLASMTVAGLLSLMVTWWASPLDKVHMNPFGTFDERNIVPVAYAAFAFALGVIAGIGVRRTLPPPDRHHTTSTMETTGRGLVHINSDLVNRIRDAPANFEGYFP